MLKCTNAQMPQFKFFIFFENYFFWQIFYIFYAFRQFKRPPVITFYFIFNIWLIIPWNNSLVRWCILAIVHWCMDVSVVCSLNPDPSACPFVLSYRGMQFNIFISVSNFFKLNRMSSHKTPIQQRTRRTTTFLDTPTLLNSSNLHLLAATRSAQDTPYTFHRLGIKCISILNKSVGSFCSFCH